MQVELIIRQQCVGMVSWLINMANTGRKSSMSSNELRHRIPDVHKRQETRSDSARESVHHPLWAGSWSCNQHCWLGERRHQQLKTDPGRVKRTAPGCSRDCSVPDGLHATLFLATAPATATTILLTLMGSIPQHTLHDAHPIQIQ